MILQRFYDDKLAHASWLVGCAETGEAMVVDPNRDADQYIEAADKEGLSITHVVETHIHADYVSGTRELAVRTGARPHLSDEGDAEWKYGWAEEARAVLLHDGDEVMVGNVRIGVLHTPGHTPEHICLVVTDTAGADRPMGVFTGDFVFVGDVGRPDLLERAAGHAGTMEAGARQLFQSLRRLERLPDYVQLWPAHGAGSACGKSLGAVPQSTLGYERLFNWALAEPDEKAFVQGVLAGQPEPPRYFAQMKRINRDGPAVLGGFRAPPRQPADRLGPLLRADATVVDVRAAAEFTRGHVSGTLSIPLGRTFSTRAGSLLPYGRDLYLLVGDAAEQGSLDEAIRDLAFVGHDRIAGWFGADALRAWAERAGKLQTAAEVTTAELAERMAEDAVTVVDVRGRAEWEEGHLPGVRPGGGGHRLQIPLDYLPDRLATLPRDRPIVVHCRSGARSAIAASLLRAHGFDDVANLQGGFERWLGEGRPVETDEAAPVT